MCEGVKVLKSHFTGTIGELSINLLYQKNNIVCTSLESSDFGEDLLCDIFSLTNENKTSIKTGFSFRTQVKTTEKLEKSGYIRKTENGFSISLETKLLKVWKQSFYPVILVIWDASNDVGYWCFPDRQLNKTNLGKKTLSIHIKESDIFDNDGIQKIREQVIFYYTSLYKVEGAKHQCHIYPIWMPDYRLLTSMETNSFFSDKKNVKVSFESADMLPTFLSSYNNCNFGNFVSGIIYYNKVNSLDQFWNEVNHFISKIELTLEDGKWLSFIVSPVELVSDMDDRKISDLTNWSCLSLIGDKIVSDFDFTYNLQQNYIYSERDRAMSDSQDLFVHTSGDFAIEVFSTGFLFSTRKSDSELMESLYNKCYCIIDISKCVSKEVKKIEKWSDDNDFVFMKLDDENNKIIVSHKSFRITDFGTLMPGISTWKDWDNIDFESEKFLSKIPYGIPLNQSEKKKVFSMYYQFDDRISDFCQLNYSQTLWSEALCHNNRMVRLITYIKPINVNEYSDNFEELKKHLNKLYKQFELYYEPYQNISNVILEVQPEWFESTLECINKIEKLYHDFIKMLVNDNSSQKNMAYYVKYYLNRWLPEELVNNNSVNK